MPVKKSGLVLLNTVASANEKYPILHWESAELIQAMTGGGTFSNTDHLLALREEMCDRQKNWYGANDAKLKGLFKDLNTTARGLILHAKNIGAWKIVQVTMVTDKLLSAMEFSDLLCARYNVTRPNLRIDCCKGGQVIARHNKVCGKLLYIERRALTSTSVWSEPLIHPVRNISERDIRQGSDKLETQGDVIIQGLWDRHTDSIINVNLGDAGADSYSISNIILLKPKGRLYTHG